MLLQTICIFFNFSSIRHLYPDESLWIAEEAWNLVKP